MVNVKLKTIFDRICYSVGGALVNIMGIFIIIPDPPTIEQKQQLADERAKVRREEQKLAQESIQRLHKAASEGSLVGKNHGE